VRAGATFLSLAQDDQGKGCSMADCCGRRMTDLFWRRVGGLGVVEVAYRAAMDRNIFLENTSA
jgi:hypothetical protein